MDAEDEVFQVAMLALSYREIVRRGYRGELEFCDDLSEIRGDLSLAVLGAMRLSDDDWALLDQLSWRNGCDAEETWVPVARDIAFRDPLRAEALLHAGKRRAGRKWAWGLTARWDAVAAAMDSLVREGYLTPHDTVNEIAYRAYASVSGISIEEYEERFAIYG